ncbi:hypothetical protein RHSIM_Rhsim12G0104200 [Rhododendron simsii]|uniref:Myb/SANT-like domain-containing protein n=1 Tax=Rhododendron simsii TaxID=118357 RepID=A0A834L8E6_RHOSS|nr:hypothetical protein RHSIM_Rhsim12G0104200 [Rhododendron simsii]
MLEEARKDYGTNSNKCQAFNSLQWTAILEELKKRTNKTDYTPIKIHQKFDRLKKDYRLFKDLTERSGMGWDTVSQIVIASADVWVTYLQEQELRNQGKAIKFSDSTFSDGKKQMSDGSGGPSSKSMRCEQKEAYNRVAYANQKNGDYFDTLTQCLEAKNYSIEACLEAMNPLKPFVSDTAFYKAYAKLLKGVHYREGFIKLTPDDRALAVELVRRGLLKWDHKNLSVEESLAIFLYICGQNAWDRAVADTSVVLWILCRAICNLAPFIIRPPNHQGKPLEILHDGRYYPWFQYYTISMGSQKFYVVFVGRNPGIYNDWPACSAQVNRFPGVVHKKYTSWDEAYNAWVTFTRQVEDTAPPSLLLLAIDSSGSSTDYTHPARDWFGLGLILAMVFFFGVVVAIKIIMVL